jgi:stalled ribosome alternative rescue factor ArfA
MKINPIAKAVAMQRRKYATQIVKPKKGKGSYERKTKDIQNKIKKDLQEQEE